MFWGSSDTTQHDVKDRSNFIDPDDAFSTDEVFHCREDLIEWVQKMRRSNGYVIVIKRSRTSKNGVPSKVVFACERGGVYRGKSTFSRDTGMKKDNGPFELLGSCSSIYDNWMLRVICGAHNHKPAKHMEGHPYAMRLSEKEMTIVKELSNKNVKPHNILSSLKEQNPDNASTLRTIYNARNKLCTTDQAGRSQMQVLTSFLQDQGYLYYVRANDSTNDLEDLFFIHLISLKLWQAFPHVLLMDATYKTNKYNMPLLEIVENSSSNNTFCITFVFMHKETEYHYTWALNCLKSTISDCVSPYIIVTDRELALMKSCRNVFAMLNNFFVDGISIKAFGEIADSP